MFTHPSSLHSSDSIVDIASLYTTCDVHYLGDPSLIRPIYSFVCVCAHVCTFRVWVERYISCGTCGS